MKPQLKTFTVIAKKLFQLSFICLALSFLVKTVLIVSTAKSPESTKQERTLKLKTFKDMPLVIHKVRNLESDDWHKDLEIEVKNISNKPIYFMLAYLIFPDQPAPAGGQAGIRLMYGDPKRNGHIDRYSQLEDEHIAPGGIYVFTIPEIDRNSLAARHKKSPELYKKFELEFAIINFGDGTGFIAGRGRDYRGKSFAPPPPEKQIFKDVKLSHSTSTSTPVQDGCGGGNCFRWFVDPEPVPTSCNCRSTLLATTFSGEPCSHLKLVFFACAGDGNFDCHDDVIDAEASASCPGGTPPPPHRRRRAAPRTHHLTRVAIAATSVHSVRYPHTGSAIPALKVSLRTLPSPIM